MAQAGCRVRSLPATSTEAALSTSALSVTKGDFNGDGKLDMAVANVSSGSVTVLLGNGDGTFRSEVGFSAGGNTYPYSVAENDFTGAGGSDLAVATEVGASIVL